MEPHLKFIDHVDAPKRRVVKLTNRTLILVSSIAIVIFAISYATNQFLQVVQGGEYEVVRVASYNGDFSQDIDTEASVKGINTNPVTLKSKAGDIDYRAYVLDHYFKANSSPLYGTGELFVKACDKYGAPADCLTVAAIAEAETDLCKYHTSATYYNCWGFGGGGEHRIYFQNWGESIDLVTDRLVNAYGLEYMIDPSLMERTFCGWEPGCTNWGTRVKFFMKKISDYPLSIGLDRTLLSFR